MILQNAFEECRIPKLHVQGFIYTSCFFISNLLLALSMMFLVFVLKFSVRLIVVLRHGKKREHGDKSINNGERMTKAIS